MKWLTEKAVLTCDHVTGIVRHSPSQSWVKIQRWRVLVASDPELKPILGCPDMVSKPCTLSLAVEKGYSTWIRIDGNKVCLDSLKGATDHVAPIKYTVKRAGQRLVESDQ